MANLTISVTESTKQWIEESLENGTMSSPDAYLRQLILNDRMHNPDYQMSLEDLQQMLDDSVASGISTKTVQEIFEEAKQRHAARRASFA